MLQVSLVNPGKEHASWSPSRTPGTATHSNSCLFSRMCPTGDWEWLPELQAPTWPQPCTCGWLPHLLVPTSMAFPFQGFLPLLQASREPVLKHLEILHPVSPDSFIAIHTGAVSTKVLFGSKVALGKRSMAGLDFWLFRAFIALPCHCSDSAPPRSCMFPILSHPHKQMLPRFSCDELMKHEHYYALTLFCPCQNMQYRWKVILCTELLIVIHPLQEITKLREQMLSSHYTCFGPLCNER